MIRIAITAEAFDAIRRNAAARLYSAGQLVRLLKKGDLEAVFSGLVQQLVVDHV